MASPAWLEKQPCAHPHPQAGSVSGPTAGGAGGSQRPTGSSGPPCPVPSVATFVATSVDGAARPPITAHRPSVVKKTGSVKLAATVHSPGAPSGTARHTFALASASGYISPTSYISSGITPQSSS